MNTRKCRGYKLVVVGLGGGGSNALEQVQRSLPAKVWWDVTWLVCDADAARLARVQGAIPLALENEASRGMGCGGDPEVGRAAAFKLVPQLRQHFCGASLVVVLAGLGGGGGSGAASVVLGTAKEMGITTAALVTLPFRFEGARKAAVAEKAVTTLEPVADFLMVAAQDQVMAPEAGMPLAKALEQAGQHWIAPLEALLATTWEPGDEWSNVTWEVGPEVAGTDQGATVRVVTPQPGSVESGELWKWRLLRFDETPKVGDGSVFSGTSLANGWLSQWKSLKRVVAAAESANGARSILEATRAATQLPLIQAHLGKARKAVLALATSVPDLGSIVRSADMVRSAMHPEGHLDVSVVWTTEQRPAATAWLMVEARDRDEGPG